MMPAGGLWRKARSWLVSLDVRGRWLLALGVLAGGMALAGLGAGGGVVSAPAPAVVAQSASRVEQPLQNGYFLEEDIDRKAYVKRLEAQYFSVQEKNQALAASMDELGQAFSRMEGLNTQLSRQVADIDRRMREYDLKMADTAVDGAAGLAGGVEDAIRKYQLDVINVNPVQVQDAGDVYLPAGSFVRATLLTGVYAPSDIGNPLPVLLRLDEAFYGPNEARIPLKGAFAIGKAVGDLNSARALVQVATLSAVLPDGGTFEHKGNIGYVTDEAGQLGVGGVVVRNTGGQLAMSFMTGFMGGASRALADSQTTVVTGESGHAVRSVTGSRAGNAAFEGLAQSAGQMSKYYQDQLDKVVAAVKVDAGVEVYLVVLEGVVVHGLKKNSVGTAGFIS